MIHELRIYTPTDDNMGALLRRFRDHTLRLFDKHDIVSVGYWLNSIGGRSDELWYMLAFDDFAQREQAWAGFLADPEWLEVRRVTEADGPLVHHIENRILSPTSFSPLR